MLNRASFCQDDGAQPLNVLHALRPAVCSRVKEPDRSPACSTQGVGGGLRGHPYVTVSFQLAGRRSVLFSLIP